MEGTEATGDDYVTLAIAPHFNKKLVAVGVGPGDFDEAGKLYSTAYLSAFVHVLFLSTVSLTTIYFLHIYLISVDRARVLAQRQVDTLNNVTAKDDDGPTSPIQLRYSDGSMVVSHIAYLSMLPFDAVGNPNYESKAIEGLEPWYEPMDQMTVPNEAFKAIVEWSNYSLSDHLGYSPCLNITNGSAGGGQCDRIILDGDRYYNGTAAEKKSSQLVRQGTQTVCYFHHSMLHFYISLYFS